jgi:multisubunit Na+/H+ antiporter MnhB subunit
MTLLFGFAPFLLFAILSRLSADLALWLAFAASFVVTIRDFVESPSLRLLDGASLVLFGLLALIRGFLAPDLSLTAVRTIVETGLCLVILASLARKKPFSLEYASQESGGVPWPLPVFRRVNWLISLVWGLSFAFMALADAAVTFLPVPFYVAIGISVVALASAITFTLRYPALAAAKLAR